MSMKSRAEFGVEECIVMSPELEAFYLGDIRPSSSSFQPLSAETQKALEMELCTLLDLQSGLSTVSGSSMATATNSIGSSERLAEREYQHGGRESASSSSAASSSGGSPGWTGRDNRSGSAAAMVGNLDVSQIIGQRLALATIIGANLFDRCLYDSNGSQYIQQRLKAHHDEQSVALVIDYILRHKAKLLSMYTHLHSSYVIQMVYKYCTEHQQQVMIALMIEQNIVLKACKSKHSARVLHQMIKCVTPPSLAMFAAHLESMTTPEWTNAAMVMCLNDGRLSSIIKAIVEAKLPYHRIKFVQDALESDLVNWSVSIYGCRIVQAFIQSYGDKLNLQSLLEGDGFLYLCQTKYGNYVIQRIIEKNSWNQKFSADSPIKRFRDVFIDRIFTKQNVVKLSRNKYGSNVVELCMKIANKKQIDTLIAIMIGDEGHVLNLLSRDSFGHFVVRTLNQCIVKANCFDNTAATRL